MSDAAALLLEPLQYPFMVRGLLQVLLLSVATGLVGVFVVQRNLTFFSHALAHSAFPSLIVAAVLGISPVAGAIVGAAIALAILLPLRGRSDVGDDSAVGIVFVGLFALGVVLVGLLRVRSASVGAAVVGNLLGIDAGDLALSAGLVAALAGLVGVFYRPLAFSLFDPSGARALGLPSRGLDALLLGMIAATMLVSVQAVGVILAVAALVTPAAAARLWARRLPSLIVLAAALGAGAGALGLYVAYYVTIAPAAVIVLALSGTFLVSALAAPRGLRVRLAGPRPDGPRAA
jgi:manganese/iron transport system permease protein